MVRFMEVKITTVQRGACGESSQILYLSKSTNTSYNNSRHSSTSPAFKILPGCRYISIIGNMYSLYRMALFQSVISLHDMNFNFTVVDASMC